MRGDDGGGIPGESPDDSEWEGGRDATELDNPGRGGRATEISYGIPGQGRHADLTGGGMPGPSGDKDGDAGELPAPACPRHLGHYTGWKPPLSTVQLMRHAGPPVGPERQAPCHSPVSQGSG